MFLIAGLYSSIQTFNLSREGQITDRFTKAIDQLGATSDKGESKTAVRIGGIYSLGRIARDSERDRQMIVDVLTTYVRNARLSGGNVVSDKPGDSAASGRPVGGEVQAILIVLGRPDDPYDRHYVNLTNANLRGANIRGGNFAGANFGGAALIGADLDLADLRAAKFSGANLNDAALIRADVSRANLSDADLEGAYLSDANLTDADFQGSSLVGAHVRGADFTRANLGAADLKGIFGLTQQQLESAIGDGATILPDEFQKPVRWHK
jgi:hypothetical protein